MTRDRIEIAEWRGKDFELIDTGGIVLGNPAILQQIYQQAETAIQKAAAFLCRRWRAGVTPLDPDLAKFLTKKSKEAFVLSTNATARPYGLPAQEFC